MDKILLMLQLQNELNNTTNGKDWVKKVTKNGKTINWRRCIYMEACEMIDSFAWKHWKNIDATPNYENLKIEVVDIWHFVMSLAIENYYETFKGSLEEIAIDATNVASFELIQNENEYFEKDDAIMTQVEKLMQDVLCHEKVDTKELFEDFFKLVSMCGLNLSSLYKLYIGKNILNQFRQDNGYKEGSYIKSWDGKEDNVYMQELLDQNPDIKPDELYKELTKLYHQING